MLTPEQRAVRLTGVGASEVSALVGLSPYKGPIDVWMVKRGLVTEHENPQTEVGSALEDGLITLYEQRTGRSVHRPHDTRRHPIHAHVLASPDGLVHGEPRGCEVKVIGQNLAHHWEADTIPDYVLCQVAQNLAVCDLESWDVLALIGGTDFRIYSVRRDHAFEDALIEACEGFWLDHVETGIPPVILDWEERKRYLSARYPGSEKTACRVEMSPKAARLIKRLAAAKATEERAKARAAEASTKLLAMVGADYGIEGPWGKLIAPKISGRPDWKGIAEELAGGTVPNDLIEQHRGEPFRQTRFYPLKAKKTA